MNTSSDFDTAFDSWLEGCKKIYNDYMAESFPNNPLQEELYVAGGRKYIKIGQRDPNNELSGSAWAFVDTTNGDVLKPAGWKSPAKTARGNIFDNNNGLGMITAYGPKYLRG